MLTLKTTRNVREAIEHAEMMAEYECEMYQACSAWLGEPMDVPQYQATKAILRDSRMSKLGVEVEEN